MTVDIFGDEDTCVKVYNPNEVNPAKKLIGTYTNYQKAGNALGISPKDVYRKCASKRRVKAPNLENIEVAIRLAKSNFNG